LDSNQDSSSSSEAGYRLSNPLDLSSSGQYNPGNYNSTESSHYHRVASDYDSDYSEESSLHQASKGAGSKIFGTKFEEPVRSFHSKAGEVVHRMVLGGGLTVLGVVGTVAGIALAVVASPLIAVGGLTYLGFLAGKKIEASVEKASAQYKSQACRIGGLMKNFFTQRIPEALSPRFIGLSEALEKGAEILEIIEEFEFVPEDENGLISQADLIFMQKVENKVKNRSELNHREINRIENIHIKVTERKEVGDALWLLISLTEEGNVILKDVKGGIPCEAKAQLLKLVNKMIDNDTPAKPLSRDEVKKIMLIIREINKKQKINAKLDVIGKYFLDQYKKIGVSDDEKESLVEFTNKRLRFNEKHHNAFISKNVEDDVNDLYDYFIAVNPKSNIDDFTNSRQLKYIGAKAENRSSENQSNARLEKGLYIGYKERQEILKHQKGKSQVINLASILNDAFHSSVKVESKKITGVYEELRGNSLVETSDRLRALPLINLSPKVLSVKPVDESSALDKLENEIDEMLMVIEESNKIMDIYEQSKRNFEASMAEVIEPADDDLMVLLDCIRDSYGFDELLKDIEKIATKDVAESEINADVIQRRGEDPEDFKDFYDQLKELKAGISDKSDQINNPLVLVDKSHSDAEVESELNIDKLLKMDQNSLEDGTFFTDIDNIFENPSAKLKGNDGLGDLESLVKARSIKEIQIMSNPINEDIATANSEYINALKKKMNEFKIDQDAGASKKEEEGRYLIFPSVKLSYSSILSCST
jgi:hypothetical protein